METTIIEQSYILLPEEKAYILWLIEKDEISKDNLEKLVNHLHDMEEFLEETKKLYDSNMDGIYSDFLKKNIATIRTNIKKLEIQTNEVLSEQKEDTEKILQSIS